MFNHKNSFSPNESQVPTDWPYRENSKMINIDDFLWHVQIFKKNRQNRPLFLLIHGTGGAVHSWHEMVEVLHNEADLILVDLPGHGFTQESHNNDYSLSRISSLLKRLLAILNINRINLVIGHSAGAALAIELSIKNNLQQITGLIGINPSLVPPPVSYNLLLNPWVSPLVASTGFTSILSFVTQKTPLIENLLTSTGSQLNSNQKKLYKKIFLQDKHLKGAIKFMASTDLFYLLSKSKHLKTNTTFIIGKEDPWVKVDPLKKIIAQNFPNSKIIENTGGHLMHETCPKKISAQILTVFNDL